MFNTATASRLLILADDHDTFEDFQRALFKDKTIQREILLDIGNMVFNYRNTYYSFFPELRPVEDKPRYPSSASGNRNTVRNSETLINIQPTMARIYDFTTFRLTNGPTLGEIRIGELPMYLARYKRLKDISDRDYEIVLLLNDHPVVQRQCDDLLPLANLPPSEAEILDKAITKIIRKGQN